MSPPDALAISMLAILLVAIGTLMTIFHSLRKNAGKVDEIEELMSEVEQWEKTPSGKAAPLQEWEKDADWWKNS
jgi:hypothetical protein